MVPAHDTPGTALEDLSSVGEVWSTRTLRGTYRSTTSPKETTTPSSDPTRRSPTLSLSEIYNVNVCLASFWEIF